MSAFAPTVLPLALLVAVGGWNWPAVTLCTAGDVLCLIRAMEAAQTNDRRNVILLKSGTYTLTEPHTEWTIGPVGLPVVTGRVHLVGIGRAPAVIERMSTPGFRLLAVEVDGRLGLERVSLVGGDGRLRGGGAIYNLGHVSLVGSVLKANSADRGGAIYNTGTVSVRRCLFLENGAGHPGGAIYNEGSLEIHDSPFESNVADNGGAISNRGSMVITSTRFSANSAHSSPAFWSTGDAIVVDSSFVGHRTRSVGGGVITNTGAMALVSSTLAANDIGANSTGAVVSNGGNMRLLNVTLADNTGTPSFGNVAIRNSGSGVLTLQNVISARNERVGSDCDGTITSLGHNIIGDPSGCAITLQPTDRIGDPGLGALWRDIIPLRSDSPAIDAGDPSACPPRDQRGFRRVDGDGDGTIVCDIGAVEYVRHRRPW